jgi:hypothetical protein
MATQAKRPASPGKDASVPAALMEGCHPALLPDSFTAVPPMRPSDFRSFLALLFLIPLAAPGPAATPQPAIPFRTTASRDEDDLRDPQLPASARRGDEAPFDAPRRRTSGLPGGDELFLQPTTFTPYDRYFNSVRAVIANLEPREATMVTVCHLMKVGHSFTYLSRDPYRPDPPRLTEAQHSGDCKSKALWLYDSLADAGALFVIGKSEKNVSTSHAWVYWRGGGRWWILDCTDRSDPIAADTVSPDRYVPYYSYGKNGTYRHKATWVGPAEKSPAGSTAAVGTHAASSKKSR